ncbi:hypothetical protein Tco_0299210 [Tanacetum coccineum]
MFQSGDMIMGVDNLAITSILESGNFAIWKTPDSFLQSGNFLTRQLSKEFSDTEKSSINTSKTSSTMSWKIVVMHCWKVAGALHKPKGILLKANVLYRQGKGIFSSGIIQFVIVDANSPSCDHARRN